MDVTIDLKTTWFLAPGRVFLVFGGLKKLHPI